MATRFTDRVRLALANNEPLPLIRGGDGSTEVVSPLSRVLRAVVDGRDANRRALDTLLEAGESRDGGPSWSDEESAEMTRLTEELRTQDARIVELEEQERRDRSTGQALVRLGASGEIVEVRREPMTYERHNRSQSYFRDLGLAFVGNDPEARGRLQRHAQEMDVELPRIEARRRQEFERRMAADPSMQGWTRESRDLSRTDGAGGEFVPPLWLMEEYAAFARAGRPFADGCRQIPLPAGTDSINIPRIASGTATAAQSADNAAVQETDATTDSVTGAVNTYAGQQDIALQAIEQSPLVFDEIILQDLTGDYNATLDADVINGPGTGKRHLGVLNVGSINAVTYTSAAPTVPELFPKGADAVQQVATNRHMPPNVGWMHPRRWFWHTAALGTDNRPFVTPALNGPMNAMGITSPDPLAEGPVGTWHLPIRMDANMPTNLGAGTDEDRIIIARMMDLLLFEGALRTRALPEVGSGTLTVRFQVYAYSAFIGGRYEKAIAVISGTGLVTPTF